MGVDSLLPAPVTTNNSVAGVNFPNSLFDDASKKFRKPYTITKSRQNWTDIEHDKFLEALHLFDRDWKLLLGPRMVFRYEAMPRNTFLRSKKVGQMNMSHPLAQRGKQLIHTHIKMMFLKQEELHSQLLI